MARAPDQRLQQILLDLARTLVASYDIGDILDSLCDHIAELLPVTGAGVMLLQRNGDPAAGGSGSPDGRAPARLLTVATSDARIHTIERLQLQLGEGPCFDAWDTGEQILAADLATSEPRWPGFAPAAVETGIRAVHSFPLRFEQARIGALNVFCDAPARFDEGDADLAQLLADIVTIYVINARTLGQQLALSTQLQHALDSRVVIEQAKGKLSEILDVDVDTAFQRMRSFARGQGLRLREVARGVVDGTVEVGAGDWRGDPSTPDLEGTAD